METRNFEPDIAVVPREGDGIRSSLFLDAAYDLKTCLSIADSEGRIDPGRFPEMYRKIGDFLQSLREGEGAQFLSDFYDLSSQIPHLLEVFVPDPNLPQQEFAELTEE